MLKHYVTTTDGEVYAAKSALEFVQALKDSSRMAQDLTINQFMRDAGQRAEQDTGFKIKTHSAKAFLESLIAAGLVKETQVAD